MLRRDERFDMTLDVLIVHTVGIPGKPGLPTVGANP
jgi:predicted phosphoribosyltransferase